MTQVKEELQILNVSLTLQLGKGRNYWGKPNVSRYENFEIPVRMFTVKALADLIGDMVAGMPKDLAEEIARIEAAEEEARKQEAIIET